MFKRAATVVLGLSAVLAGCGQHTPAAAPATVTHTVTVTTTPPAPAAPAAASTPTRKPSRSWTGSGTFAVGDRPHDGLLASIPPGRYTVTLADGRDWGVWARCSAATCGPGNLDTVIRDGIAQGPGFAAVVEVEPTDTAVWMEGVEFTPVD